MKKASITLKDNQKLIIELYDKEAPLTVENFEKLANSGYYNGLTFHRVIKDFVVQGGCPEGSGRGGPGYKIKCETANNPHKHNPGSLSMAHAGKDTGGSQFFICHVDLPHLDGVHTVFGKVIEGLENIYNIKQGDLMIKVEVS